jgi:RNA polymerase sigma-70 factor (ECF subfamily)
MEIHEISNEMIRKASCGDRASRETIYLAAAGFVYNVALRIVGNPDDAQEVAQDTFIKLFEGLKDFKQESSLKTWAYRITVNTALNYRSKAANRFQCRMEQLEDIEAEILPKENPIEAAIDQQGKEKVVRELLNALTPDQRACIVLREMQGLSYEEIAQVLGININTVRSRLKRAREILLKKSEVVTDEL